VESVNSEKKKEQEVYRNEKKSGKSVNERENGMSENNMSENNMSENNTNEENNKLTLEQCFEKIEKITSDLQAGELDLEESFKIYKEGMDLLKVCNDKIEDVEKKVLVMREDGHFDEF